MKWRWLWVIKNRKGEYWRKNKCWTPKLQYAGIYASESSMLPALKEARKTDFTAYAAKGTFEISELA